MTREEAINALDIVKHIESLSVLYEPGEPMNQTTVGELKEACKMAISILRAQTDTPPNDPLTLEQLREMDGEPVWCESEHRPDGSGWFIVDASALQPHEFIAIRRERGIPCAGIDTGYWLAYRHKPEAFGMQRLEVWVEEP